MGRLLRYMWRLDRSATALSVVVSALAGVLLAVVPLLTGLLVARLARSSSSDLGTVLWTVLMVSVCLAATAVAPMVLQTLSTRLSDEIVEDTTRRLAQAVSSARSLALLEDSETATMRSRLRSRMWEIKGGGRQLIGPATQTVVAGVAGTVALVMTAGGLPAVALAAALILHIVWATVARRRELDLLGRNVEEQKHAEYAFSLALDDATKELRIFGLGDFLGRRYWDMFTVGIAPYWRGRGRTAVVSLAPVLIRAGVGLGVLLFIAHLGSDGTITIGQFAAAVPLVIVLSSLYERSFDTVLRGGAVLDWLQRFEAATGSPASTSHHRPIRGSLHHAAPIEPPGHPIGVVTGAVVFDEVSFTYPGSPAAVLDRVSFQMRPGEPLALVGVNGAGKSTLVKLLCGGYAPTAGAIYVDGRNLNDLDNKGLRTWQRSIGLIGQEFLRLPLTIGDNVEIGAGQLAELTSDARTRSLHQAADQAGLAELVGDLPAGWKTPLDRSQPGGTELSGGEWQRVALARMIRGIDSGRVKVALLDEPAAALDVEAEAHMVDEYLSWVQSISSLIISHRFSVVRPIDRIMVLDHGRIAEYGSHRELIQRDGTYRRLFDNQAAQFLADRPGDLR